MSDKSRSTEEIRNSIEQTRQELVSSVHQLKQGVSKLADWRSRVRANRTAFIVGAAVTGFVVAGGLSAIGGLFSRSDSNE